jgi:NitT/TauT family transport system permease protein
MRTPVDSEVLQPGPHSDHRAPTMEVPGKSRITRLVDNSRLTALRLAVAVLFIVLWHLTWTWFDPLVARSPLQVGTAFVQLIEDGVLWTNLWATASATIIAFALGSVVGVVVGIGLGLLPTLEAVLNPYIDALNSLPRIALAPVFIVYFGIGQSAKIALAFSLVVFVMLVAARAGIRSADPDIVKLCKSMDLTKVQMFFKVLLPTAYPSIFGGLRLSAIYSMLGVVASEIIASKVGLGQLIAEYSGTFQMASMYAVILVLLVVASVLNMAMAALEKYILRWQTSLV